MIGQAFDLAGTLDIFARAAIAPSESDATLFTGVHDKFRHFLRSR
jgi:hypothetical protein